MFLHPFLNTVFLQIIDGKKGRISRIILKRSNVITVDNFVRMFDLFRIFLEIGPFFTVDNLYEYGIRSSCLCSLDDRTRIYLPPFCYPNELTNNSIFRTICHIFFARAKPGAQVIYQRKGTLSQAGFVFQIKFVCI